MTRNPASQLAQRVRERMTGLGITQGALARNALVNRSYVSDLLCGRKAVIRDDAMQRFATVLRCSVAYLAGDTDDPAAIEAAAPPRRAPPTPRVPAYLARRTPDRDDPAARNRAPDLPTEWSSEQRHAWIEEQARLDREQRDYDRALDRLGPEIEMEPALAVDAALTLFELRMWTRPILALGRDPTAKSTGGKHTASKSATAPVPVFGQRYGQGLRIEDGAVLHHMARPLPLAGWPGVYAVVWPDDGLDPRIRRGETLVVVPRADIRPGDDVLVLTQTAAPAGNVVAGRLIAARRDCIVLAGPGGIPDVVVPAADLRAIHRVGVIITAGL